MEESEDIMSVDSSDSGQSGSVIKPKPKKRSLIERELETSLTARVTSPVISESNTSRYGRARRLKTDSDFCDTDKAVATALKSPRIEKSQIKSPPAYKMHAVNSPVRMSSQNPNANKLNNQLDNIYNVNISLSCFGSEEKRKVSPPPVKKFPKIYSRQDLVQTKEKDETIILINNMFSPAKSAGKQSSNHVDNFMDRSAEKYNLNHSSTGKQNGFDTSSVVKTLDFDGNRKKKSKNSREGKVLLSKSELFELEAQCEFQVGDLAWARMGTFPFWPCIVTREPGTEMFVKNKLFGLKERDVIHVTFFGDNGRHSWVLDKLLRPFFGQKEFENARDKFTPEEKKKDPRLYAAFFISDKKQSLWNASVLEAEALMKEPKRLRIDIFYDNLEKSRMQKPMLKGQKKLARADSDVSLSESLFDTLFSEEDGRDDNEKYRKRNNSLDVSEVVTACLDNMAAKSGLANIQKQSHMDRWLQKAKSNTPEKKNFKVTISVESVDEIKENKVKENSKKDSKKKKKFTPREEPVQKPYSFRKSVVESQNKKETTAVFVEKVESLSTKVHKNEIITSTDESKDSINDIYKNGLVSSGISDCESEKTEALQNDKMSSLDIQSLKSNNCDLASNQKVVKEFNNKNITPNNSNVDKETSVDKEKHEIIGDVSDCNSNGKNNVKETEEQCSEKDLTNTVNEVEMLEENLIESNDIVNSSKGNLNLSTDSNLTDCESLLNNKTKSEQEKDNLNTSIDSDLTDCENLLEVESKSMTEIKTPENNEIMKSAGILDEPLSSYVSKIDRKILKDKSEPKPVDEKGSKNILQNHVENGFSNEMDETVNFSKTHEDVPYKIKVPVINAKDYVFQIDASIELVQDEKSPLDSSSSTYLELINKDKIIESSAAKKPTKEKKNKEISNDVNLIEELQTAVKETINEGDKLPNNVSKKQETIKNFQTAVIETMNEGDKLSNCHSEKQETIKNFQTAVIETMNEGDKLSNCNSEKPETIKNFQTAVKETMNEGDEISNYDSEKQETIKFVSEVANENESNQMNGTLNNVDLCNKLNGDEKEIDDEINAKHEEDKPIECLSDDDFDTISINSAISEISITENEKLSFRRGPPASLLNGFHDDFFDKIKEEIKEEPKELDTVSMNSESDNLPLKDLKLQLSMKKSVEMGKPESEKISGIAPENIISEKDIKSEQISEYVETIGDDMPKNKTLAKVGKVVLERIEIEKYLNTALNVRKSKRLRNKKEKSVDELKLDAITAKAKVNVVDDIIPVEETLPKAKESSELNTVSPPKDKHIKVKEISELVSQEKVNNLVNTQLIPDQTMNTSETVSVEERSMNCEESNASSTKQKSEKPKIIKEENMEDPEFKLYLELKQDRLIDEHPELTYDEIVAYLHKTWLYERSLKTDVQKTDDIEPTELIKTEKTESPSTKKTKKNRNEKKKSVDTGKQSKKITDFIQVTPRDKPKRKVSQPYYNEDVYSDIEDEIEMFEIFRQKPQDKKPSTKTETPKGDVSKIEISSEIKIKTDSEIKHESESTTLETEGNKSKTDIKETEGNKPKTDIKETVEIKDDVIEQIDTILDEYYDEEELYFEQLTKPKPNVFKGYIREKVCEICEKKSNLVKCKGCNGMFHVDCIKKAIEEADATVHPKGRKKKKKPRGRKPKSSADSTLDSEGNSDDKSQDPNASLDLNDSIEDLESHTIADAENFEAQLEAKMKELLENNSNNIQYDSYSSDDGLDWQDTETGKCKIVDIKLKEKPVETTELTDFKCNNCQKYDTPICFVCKSAVSPKTKSEIRQRCQVGHCHKYYHLECLDHWPQTQFISSEPSKQDNKVVEPITCPRHVCHTCVCDDPRGCKTRFCGDKLARCVRCPATYHTFSKCLPAGTEILTASHIICPRHYEHRPGKVPYHVNTGWCFICALGGSLICCEYCPTSFHAECLNISPPEGGYMCEDCETGRLPLYGEMVWVKLGHYRWWPGLILHPSEIPSNIMAVKHALGEFVVRFFGQYDHYWVNRGRVFPFQEGDTGRISSQRSKIDEAFTKAMDHANRAFEILKNTEPNEEENLDIASSLLPPQYVKLKVNKPCGSLYGKRIEIEESSLTQCDCNPDVEAPCGPDSHCLNRMLLTECGPLCRAGERCQNRALERRQYPALVPYRTPHRGWGLKTTEPIRAGQFVIEYVGELIDMEEFQRRMRRKHEMRDENFYFLTLDKERMIDAGPKGNLARFMNHCCEPNCETQKWTVLGDVRVGLFAIHDIPANTEVTFNYNLECAGIDKKRCMCGAKRCSGYIGAKPKQEESQPKKPKLAAKRTYKKRKNAEESPSTSKAKIKKPVGRPAKPRELTEIEKDLLIIKNAASAVSSDSEGSGRLSSEDLLKVNVNANVDKDTSANETEKKPLKRKRVSFSAEDKLIVYDGVASPSVKKVKLENVSENVESVSEKETVSAVGD